MAPQEPAEKSPALSADLSNLRIGEFLLLRRLGSGGMADVYLAEQSSLGRQVAVKVLKNDAISGGTDVLLKRFEQEARAAGGLSHPNLIQIITTGREGDISYIVQEYVPGLNLSQWIRKNGPPDYGTGLRWMQQVAAALHVASDAGIVHRDVKPENIMVTRSGVAKVTDFGLAQLHQPAQPKMNLTQAGTTMGTPWYMSPEQIQGEKLDHRSDQYSLGVTCYQMFAGQPPFPGKNAVTVAVQHLKEEPLPLNTLRADLPKELCDVIHRMLEKKPVDRFQTGAELEAALAQLDSVPVNSNPRWQKSFIGQLLTKLVDIRRAGIAAIAILAIAFVAGRKMERPIRLPDPPKADTVSKEDSATKQFAVAMLQPDRAAAWQAVISNYPDTPEADVAALQMGLALMSGVVPNLDLAYEVFSGVRNKGELAKEKEHLKLLGMIGQAYVLKDRDRSNELDKLITEIKENIPDDEAKLAMYLDRAPAKLRQFFDRIQFTDDERTMPPFQRLGPR